MNKVLISHSIKDREVAWQLASKLEYYKLLPFLDESEVNFGFNLENIFSKLSVGDFWVIIFSGDSISNKTFIKDFDEIAKKQLHSRNISIIPVLVSGQNVPFEFSDRKIFNIKRNPEKELDKLARYLRNVPSVDFNSLDSNSFEKLVLALLKKLRFKNIEPSSTSIDYGYDIKATTIYIDPFGNKHEINWLIELKFYKKSRADISALNQLSGLLINLPPKYNGVLITNGQLTSAAKTWLQEIEQSNRTIIIVVDGVQLKELLLQYEDLVEEFFGLLG